jgi:hypothetical protein
MIEDLAAFKMKLSRDGIIFCFNGPTSQEILTSIGEALRQKMKEEETSVSTAQRVFSIFVEQMQNIIRYSAEKIIVPDVGNELRLGIVIVGSKDNAYYVLCGNRIENSDREKLSDMLVRIQEMDKNELKEYYKKKRKSARIGENRGAGLGFIEMAKKASEPIMFEIRKLDEHHSFFTFKAVIKQE